MQKHIPRSQPNQTEALRRRYEDMVFALGYERAFFWLSVGSTNDEAKVYAGDPGYRGDTGEEPCAVELPSREGCVPRPGTVFWALRQTAGRGRLGRNWDSPERTGIYISFLTAATSDISAITIAAGASLCRSLRESGFDAVVKWPNDLLIDGKKVCGILSEYVTDASGRGYVVVGVGLNLSGAFSGELAESAASLFGADEERQNEERLLLGLKLVLESVGRTVLHYSALEKSIFIDYARKYSATINEEVEVHQIHDREGYVAKAVDICENGALLVELRSGERRQVVAGEVTLRRKRAADI